MLKIVERNPHRKTSLPGDIEVSSVHYDIYLDGRRISRYDETMIFYDSGKNERSERYGMYKDHDKVVAKLSEL